MIAIGIEPNTNSVVTQKANGLNYALLSLDNYF